MAFPPSFIDELIARNPIEDVVGQYVSLKRSGANLFGLCPFHGEKTASFSVAPDKGIYYCFGCHKGGGAINFMMEVEGLSYPDAVRKLAQRAGMEVPEDEQYQSRYRQQERLWALHKEAARFFHSQLYAPVGKAALGTSQGGGPFLPQPAVCPQWQGSAGLCIRPRYEQGNPHHLRCGLCTRQLGQSCQGDAG